MKQLMKKAITALAVAVGITTAAQATPRTISINFGSGSGSVSGEYGIVPSSSWNNFSAAKQTTAVDVTVSDGTTGVTAMWWSANTWSWGSATDNALKGYLDDGACGDGQTGPGPHICIKGIPFANYDVIIYHATDTAPDYGGSSWGFNPAALKEWTVQTECGSQAYSYDGSKLAARNDASLKFGVTQQKTAIYGTNVSYLKKGFSWTNLDIKGGANANSARGCIAAIQIVETSAPVEYAASLSEDANWSSAPWDPSLPEAGMTTKDTATVTATGNPTLTLNGTITCGTLKIVSAEDDMLTIKKATDATTTIGTFDVSAATDGVKFDCTEGFTACSALLNAARTGNYKFYFLGEGDNGATLDYGTAQNNYNFKGHYIFDGGTHTFQNCSESAGLNFGANATKDNPTLWVKNGATLNFKSRNPCGWSAVANTDGIVRIGDGSKVVLGTSAAGTWYWAQRFYFDPGSELEIALEADKMALNGGVVADKEQLYMPASEDGVATISASGAGQLRLARDKPGAAAFVGAGSTLDVTAPLVSQNNSPTLAKTGAGTLKLSGDVSGFTAPVRVDAGTVEFVQFVANASSYTVAEGATLKLNLGEGVTNVLSKTKYVNGGTIEITGGTAIVPTDFGGTVTTSGAGVVKTGCNVGINDMGKFAIPAGKTWDTIAIFNNAGQLLEIKSHDETYVYFDWQITGGACWWDYEFDGNGNNTGTEGTALSWDGGHPFTGNEYTENGELRIPAVPWRDVNSWPETATFVMYGTMVGTDKTYQIGFGSTYRGTAYTIFLATDTVSENKVNLCITTAKNAPTVLCTMTVPNAQTAKHLYAFTLKKVDAKTVIDIYLDGELLQQYPFDTAVTLGSGFQIGSGHGGIAAGYNQSSADDPALLDWLRVYNEELTKATLEKYAVKYPYVSPNGSFRRTVYDGAEWVSDNAWEQEGTTTIVSEPSAGSTVKLTVEGAATLGVNLAADVSYEAMVISGDDLTVARAEGETAGKVVSSGRVTANANVTFKYDAFSMAGAPLTVKQGKAVVFDLSMVDMTQFFATKTYDLTGYTTLEEDATISYVAPAELYGREISAGIDETTKHYVVTVTVEEKPFVYADGAWTWGEQTVSAEAVSNNVGVAIVKSGDGDLEWPIDRSGITVNAGTLKATAVTKRAAAVTVAAGAVLDLNGKNAKEMALTLAGGKVTYGETTLAEADQIKVLTLTADSEICTPVKGQIYAAGYNTATTIALGEGNTLTKTGTNVLQAVNIDITGTGTIYVKEGEFYGSEDTRATNVTFKVAEGATLHNRDYKTMTVANVVGEGGTLNNEGTISAFTLTGSLKLANAGSYGAVTLADGATLDVGKKRGLTLAGEGTVNVALTDEEFNGTALPVTVFTAAEGANVKIGTVTHNGSVYSVRTEGGTITRILKGNIFWVK